MTKNTHPSDNEIIMLLKRGNHEAFNEILKRYSAVVINFAYRRVSDVDLAKDMAQDVFATLWEKRSDYALIHGLESHIFTAIRHRIVDHYRKQKVSQKYIDSFTAFYSIEENATDYLARYRDLSRMIEREIAALPPKLRQVFELNRKHKLTRKEIATLLNTPENTVKTNMQRALKILKNKLGDSYSLLFNYF